MNAMERTACGTAARIADDENQRRRNAYLITQALAFKLRCTTRLVQILDHARRWLIHTMMR